MVDLIESFRNDNRASFGPAWRSTTIVALRMIHLTWAHAFSILAGDASRKFTEDLYSDIYRHAKHVRRNLEWFPVRTNHYLVNLFALYLFAKRFPEFKTSASWGSFAKSELATEITHHVHADGSVHEGSVNYHRFVVEIFLTALVVADAAGENFGAEYEARLEKALSFLAVSYRPDGTLPRVGDAADIRLQHLDHRDVIADPSHLIQVGAVRFGRSDWKALAPQLSEHAFWMLGVEQAVEFDQMSSSAPRDEVLACRDGGYTVANYHSTADWLMFRSGPLALGGVSGHGHYDQLSFELWVRGEPIIVDPGWRCYEGNEEASSYLKGTGAHSTVLVDGRNQIINDLFIYPPPIRPVPALGEVCRDGRRLRLSGSHALYEDLPDGVGHERKIEFDHLARVLVVDDHLTCRAPHRFDARFHLAPSTKLTGFDDERVSFTTPRQRGSMVVMDSEQVSPIISVEDAYTSPRYGEVLRSKIINVAFEADSNISIRFEFRLEEAVD